MKTTLAALATLVLFAFSATGFAGVTPNHNTSQMGQSGAKIAAPKKDGDQSEQNKDEKDDKETKKDQEKDDKR